MSHFIGPLVRAGFNAVAVDLPAHGQSGGRQTTVLEMAQAIAEVADKVKPVEAIIAHSLGATASALAHGNGLKVKKMALIAPPSNVPYYVRGFVKRIGLPYERGEGMLEKLRQRFGDLEQFNVLRVAPKFTAVAPVKPVPVMVTDVPPAAGPLVGLTLETEGPLA